MKTLVIYAHPNIEGHCSFILKNVEKELKQRKQKYEVVDLYKIKFNPVLHEDELLTSEKRKKYTEVETLQTKIKDADKLIFIYPIWWNSPPAIMRGFIDRIFSARFGFRYEKKWHGIATPVGLLKGKEAAVFHTSGAPTFIFKTIMGGRGSKIFVNDSLRFCGIKAKGFHYGSAMKITEQTEKKLEKLVKRGMNWLY